MIKLHQWRSSRSTALCLIALVVTVSSALTTGCVSGPKASTYRPAMSPNGVDAELQVVLSDELTQIVLGELLAIDADRLLLRTRAYTIVSIRRTMIASSAFEDLKVTYARNKPTSFANLNALRLRSRFPQGISDEVLDRLLQLSGQSEIEIYQ